ncbi:RadC-like JAB domain-containing protein [Sediminibacterium magnilacihabitans]|jgi:DNA repair protein RadC|nr:RadC-like JAB domain-containing protein [Sediminibacterium magnilacihabitans]
MNTVAEIEVSYQPSFVEERIIRSAQDAYDILLPFFHQETIALKEQFIVMYLNKGNRILGVYRLSDGGMTGTVMDIRLVFSIALKIASVGIILAHNHPSANLKPSLQDISLTKQAKEAGSLLNIQVLDHLIVSPIKEEYYSFGEDGIL